jgi:KaiC/GvpD/RAD55 family RecA-like ATPase
MKGDEIAGTYGSDAPINFYILTQDELKSIQNCHLPSAARPLLDEENAIGYGNPYHSLPFPADGTYYFVFIASGPASVPSGYATVELSFPASTTLINGTTSLPGTLSPSSTRSLSNTTATTIILPTSITTRLSSQTSSVHAFGSFGTVGAIALAVIIALLGSVVLFMRRKKTPQSTVTLEQKTPPKAEPLAQISQPAANVFSTGYYELDSLLAGGLPKGHAILLLSPRCDERDLLLLKVIVSALSRRVPTVYLSNDPSKIEDLASTYREDFYALSPQGAKILSPPANLYKISNIDSLGDLDLAFTKILETRAKHGTGDRLLVVDLLTYSHIFLVDTGTTARKWFSDFLAKRKGEDFTVLAFLNPRVTSNEETQTLIDVFDGVIEIYEKELRGKSRRFLVIRRMYGHRHSESELMLDKDKLS